MGRKGLARRSSTGESGLEALTGLQEGPESALPDRTGTLAVHLAGENTPLNRITHTVSAGGAMINLPEDLPNGTELEIENLKTQKKIEARIVRPSRLNAQGSLVPIGFSTPSPSSGTLSSSQTPTDGTIPRRAARPTSTPFTEGRQ